MTGDIDAFTGAQLARDLRRCAAMGQPVIVDLRMLDFLGTRGVHVLIQFHRRCRAHGLPSVLVTSTLIDHLVRLTGTSDVLRRVGALRAALWQLGSFYARDDNRRRSLFGQRFSADEPTSFIY